MPDNRTSRKRKYPVRWTDKAGNKYEVRAAEDLTANPDMGVLLGLAALWQDYMLRHDVCFLYKEKPAEDDEKITIQYVGFRIPIREVYAATGYSCREKRWLIQSLDRLVTITVRVEYNKSEYRRGGIIFTHFFGYHYVEPDKKGQAGWIDFSINRFFIPRTTSCLWHPAKLCQSLRLPTARLLFWAVACSVRGWSGTVTDLYRLVQRTDEVTVDKRKIWNWDKRQLAPTLAELTQYGFKISRQKNTYGEDTVDIRWPNAKNALRAGLDV